ncbi:MAG TPA: endolytic transglycosylase MltG [Bacteroidales bacterium]|nr:endolytic transglycosylase MltG [Bacteroidales bacterium]
MKSKVKYIVALVFVLAVLAGSFAFYEVAGPGVKPDKGKAVIYIPTGSSYEQVLNIIDANVELDNPLLFRWIARQKNYPGHIRPGRYIINGNRSYLSFINMLRSGRQSPVKVTFNNIRTLNQLAGRIGEDIEADSPDILNFLEDPSNYSADGFNRATIISVFIPNTYELYWNTDARGLYERMLKEYNAFWNNERLDEAGKIGLSPEEVSILASIIDDEVVKADEKPRIAGVYLNRLKRDMPLQACPTIKFALNDFTITRILKKYLQVDSPYNTYTHRGFPPGPIGCPSVEGIEAVLHAEKNDFLYFAAKPDFSGYHNFSRTLAEHNHYAALYQKELDRRKIFR